MKRTRSTTPPHLRLASPVEHAGLYVEAIEAELIRNNSLERRTLERSNQPPGLLAWTGDTTQWIDRYDILNLLDAIPVLPLSPTRSDGFSDLPSDGEEMFYFEQEVREEIEREKKKRRMEVARAERIRMLDEREGKSELVLSDQPTAAQLLIMTRLHTTLLASPDPALLEIRILANHAADERFSFLRRGGQYRKIWEEMRSAKIVVEEVGGGGGLGGLVGYGSDSDEEGETAQEEVVEEETDDAAVERSKKAAKLAKATAWSAARRAEREAAITASE